MARLPFQVGRYPVFIVSTDLQTANKRFRGQRAGRWLEPGMAIAQSIKGDHYAYVVITKPRPYVPRVPQMLNEGLDCVAHHLFTLGVISQDKPWNEVAPAGYNSLDILQEFSRHHHQLEHSYVTVPVPVAYSVAHGHPHRAWQQYFDTECSQTRFYEKLSEHPPAIRPLSLPLCPKVTDYPRNCGVLILRRCRNLGDFNSIMIRLMTDGFSYERAIIMVAGSLLLSKPLVYIAPMSPPGKLVTLTDTRRTQQPKTSTELTHPQVPTDRQLLHLRSGILQRAVEAQQVHRKCTLGFTIKDFLTPEFRTRPPRRPKSQIDYQLAGIRKVICQLNSHLPHKTRYRPSYD